MPKNSSNQSPLDMLAAEMEQQAQEQAQEPSKKETEEVQGQEAKVTDYQPSKAEKHLYHVQLEKPLFDKRSGERLSKSSVQKMSEKEYKAFTSKNGEKDKSIAEMLGYEIKVLWNPKENI